MRIRYITCVWLFLMLFNSGFAQEPIREAHAHNDYVHAKPLHGALSQGFTSIEVDIFYHKGRLVVSHVPIGLASKKSLEQLYLKPLNEIIGKNNGRIYGNFDTPLVLMIDIKNQPDSCYLLLKRMLQSYHSILTTYASGQLIEQKPVKILISGSKPWNILLQEDTSYATADASIRSISKDSATQSITTRYSDAWHRYFNWKGKGEMPVEEQLVLRELVEKAHQANKQIRFYHIPDKPSVWKLLLENGVDWINTDKLSQFRSFYMNDYRR